MTNVCVFDSSGWWWEGVHTSFFLQLKRFFISKKRYYYSNYVSANNVSQIVLCMFVDSYWFLILSWFWIRSGCIFQDILKFYMGGGEGGGGGGWRGPFFCVFFYLFFFFFFFFFWQSFALCVFTDWIFHIFLLLAILL